MFFLFFWLEIGIVEKGGVLLCFEYDLWYYYWMGSWIFFFLGVFYCVVFCKGDMGLVVGVVEVFVVLVGGEGEGG